MDLLQQAQYQLWAELKYFDLLKKVPEQTFVNHIPGFPRSLQEIYIHRYEFCCVWYQSILSPKSVATTPDFASMSKSDFIAEVIRIFETIIQYIKNYDTNHLRLAVEGLKKPFDVTSDEILYNIFNHLTFHRCEISLVLKKLGFEIPETDYNPYLFETRKLI